MSRHGYGDGTGDPPPVGAHGCLPPTLAKQAVEVALPIVGFPVGLLAGIVAQPLLALPTAGAVIGLYCLGRAYAKEQRKGRRR